MSVESYHSLLAIAGEVMVVEDYTALVQPPGAVSFRGRLLMAPALAQEAVSERLAPARQMAVLERRNGKDIMTFMPALGATHRTRPRLALFLLAATVVSTLFVGGTMVQSSIEDILAHPFSGWPFALSILAILGVHEMGHFLMARRYGVQVSLPYFIPMPLGPFGTMGAFIAMSSPPRNRRQVLHIGLAGPLSGLLVAMVVTIYGLTLSELSLMQPEVTYIREGNSIAYLLLKYLVFQQWLPQGPLDVNLHPVAFAGWAGLLVTGLNLIPAAQLDGGHVAYSLLGRRARALTLGIGAVLLAMGFFWQGWLLWAFLILVLGSRRELVLDDITPLAPGERALAIGALVLFALLFVPIPLVIA